jgi:hypothetical protein
MLFFHVNGFVEFLTWFQYEKKSFSLTPPPFGFPKGKGLPNPVAGVPNSPAPVVGAPKSPVPVAGAVKPKSPPPVDIPTPLPVARPENIPDRFRTILIGHVNVFNQFRLFWNLIVFLNFRMTTSIL